MTPEIIPGIPRNIQLLISPTAAIKCEKKECYFCYLMIGRPLETHYFSGHRTKFSKADVDYLLGNYLYRDGKRVTELAIKLKRTRAAIMQKYYQLTHLK